MMAKGLGGGRNGVLLFNGYKVSVLQDENILEIGCTTMWHNVNTTEPHT